MLFLIIRTMWIAAGLAVFLLLCLSLSEAHDGYPWSCCSGQDCAPAHYGPIQLQDGPRKGWWEVHTTQAKILFKPDTVLQTFKVNGVPMPGVHACFWQYKKEPMKGYREGRCLHIGSGT